FVRPWSAPGEPGPGEPGPKEPASVQEPASVVQAAG
ncbi:TetR family transcriptional regulator, partial [Streptomyces sp. LRa12]